jgi:hypothetical protein
MRPRVLVRFVSGLAGTYTLLSLLQLALVSWSPLNPSLNPPIGGNPKRHSAATPPAADEAQREGSRGDSPAVRERRATRKAEQGERWATDGGVGGYEGGGGGGAKSATEQDGGDEIETTTQSPCGWLVPFGEVTIRHPRRKDVLHSDRPQTPVLRVSYESDRLFASPLDGMTFDSNSAVYIFLDGQPDELERATVTFELDRREPWTSITGVPFDLLGMAYHEAGPDATPLRTVDLGAPACHVVEAKVQYPDGTETRAKASFRVDNRKPKTWLITSVSVDDYSLLGFFLDTYIDAGVAPENMVIAVHAHSHNETAAIDTCVSTLKRNHVGHVHVWVGLFNTFDKFELQESFARRFVQQQDWVMHPDVDEHHRYPGNNLRGYLHRCNERGVTAVIGVMQDRLARDGSLAALRFDQPLEAQFPLACVVTKTVVGGSITKVVLHRGFLMAEEGGYVHPPLHHPTTTTHPPTHQHTHPPTHPPHTHTHTHTHTHKHKHIHTHTHTHTHLYMRAITQFDHCIPRLLCVLVYVSYHTLFEWKQTYGRKHEMVRLPPNRISVAHYKWTSTVADKLRRREKEFKDQVNQPLFLIIVVRAHMFN